MLGKFGNLQGSLYFFGLLIGVMFWTKLSKILNDKVRTFVISILFIVLIFGWCYFLGEEEYFTFDDDEKSERIWTIKFTDDHNFTASAGDVAGEANNYQKINLKLNSHLFLLVQ